MLEKHMLLNMKLRLISICQESYLPFFFFLSNYLKCPSAVLNVEYSDFV